MRHEAVRRLLAVALVAPVFQARAQLSAGPRVPWLRVAMTSEWDSNVLFQRPDGVGDYLTRAFGGAETVVQMRRGQIALTAHGEMARYATLRELNALTYDGRVRSAWTITRRLAGTFGALYRTSRTTELVRGEGSTSIADSDVVAVPEVPQVALPLLPLTISHTASVDAAANYRLTPLSDGMLALSYSRATFDSPSLLPGSTIRMFGQLARRYTSRTTILARADAQLGTTGTVATQTQAVAAGLDWRGERLSASLLGGALATQVRGEQQVSPSGAVELDARLARGVGRLRYSRSAGQTFGLRESLVTDQVGVGYVYAGWRSTLVDMRASHAWSTVIGRSDTRIVSSDGAVDLRRSFASGVVVGGTMSYRYREQGVRVSGTELRLVAEYAH